MFGPSNAVALQGCKPDPMSMSQSDAASYVERRRYVDQARFVQMAICQNAHYVLLQASRPLTSSPWKLFYYDPLPEQLPDCWAAAQNVAWYLGLLPEENELPDSPGGQQQDGWSCGLWVLQEQEHQLRQLWRNEPTSSKVPIYQILHRLNDFIGRVSPAAKAALSAVPGGTKVVPTTLQEALQAAVLCSKCHVTKTFGTKGCSQCMGPFFQSAKERRKVDPNENVVPDFKGLALLGGVVGRLRLSQFGVGLHCKA